MSQRPYLRFDAVAATAMLCLLVTGCSRQFSGSVAEVPVPLSSRFPNAVEPGTLRWICGALPDQLRTYLTGRGAPFNESLIRPVSGRQGEVCHIYYEPTLKGWKALPDDDSVSELFLNIDTLALLANRTKQVGDSLDVARSMLPRIERPLTITLGVDASHSQHYYDAAIQQLFPKSIHALRFQHLAAPNGVLNDPWVQDLVIAGRLGGQDKNLVTRRAFEGNPAMGEALKPMLDSWKGDRFFRSRLAVEGGDLTFIRDPKDRKRIILIHGSSARPYWGEALTEAEFAFVLRTEFGADESIDISGLAPHVDYAMAVLPEQRVALVGQPICNNLELARAAIATLIQAADSKVPAEVDHLARQLSTEADLRTGKHASLSDQVQRAIEAESQWKPNRHAGLTERVNAFVAANCPQRPLDCVGPAKLPSLIESNPLLLREWVEAGAQLRTSQLIGERLLGIVEHQVNGCDADLEQKLDNLIQRMVSLGFRVVRAPWLLGDDAESSWPGVSYVNAAVVDSRIFVPELGLGRIEEEWFRQLAAALPDNQLIPIPARLLLLRNGGIHCALAFGRTAPADSGS